MNPLRLEQMAYFDAGPHGLVDLAVELGISAVSMWTGEAALEGSRLVTEDDVDEVRRKLDDCGVVVDSVEVYRLSSTPDTAAWARSLEVAARLGAGVAAVLNSELADVSEAADALAVFAAVADEFGITPGLEPTARGKTRTLAEAEELVQRSGSSARIVVDVLHLVRTGQTVDALRALDPALIAGAQICDGPAEMSPEGMRNESGYDRMAPGEGDFPLVEFVAVLPPDTMLGVEVPMRALREAGWSPDRRARRAVDGTRAIQALAEQAAAQATGS